MCALLVEQGDADIMVGNSARIGPETGKIWPKLAELASGICWIHLNSKAKCRKIMEPSTNSISENHWKPGTPPSFLLHRLRLKMMVAKLLMTWSSSQGCHDAMEICWGRKFRVRNPVHSTNNPRPLNNSDRMIK